MDNYGNGVPFDDGVNQDNTVEGNYIGINANGVVHCPTSVDGIDVASTALDTVIGGTAHGAGNVISGNAGNGVVIDGTGAARRSTPLYLKADGNTNNSTFNPRGPARRQRHAGGRCDLRHGRHRRGVSVQRHGRRACRRRRLGLPEPHAVTLSAWINLNSLPGATPYVIASRAYSATSENYGLYVNSSGELVFEWYSAGAFHTETSSGADLGSRLGVFQQVAVVTDGSTVTFYVNGAAVGSSAMPDPLDDDGLRQPRNRRPFPGPQPVQWPDRRVLAHDRHPPRRRDRPDLRQCRRRGPTWAAAAPKTRPSPAISSVPTRRHDRHRQRWRRRRDQ